METTGFDVITGGLPLFDPALRIRSLRDLIKELVDDMEPGEFRSRREVEEGILRPVLSRLGWDFEDPGAVVAGFETGSGTVDWALCLPDGDPRILVGIDSPPDPDEGEREHPFDDRTIPAIQLAISEDGGLWTLHFGTGRGSIRNREFARFDIARDPNKRVAEILDTFLARHAIKSGEAFRQAERDYGEKRFPAEALAAWRRSLLGPELLERFLVEMKEATGVFPSRARAEGFVRGQVDGRTWAADPPDPRPARRVAAGDRVWVYDFAAREIVTHVVVGGDPDWEAGEVSRDSPIGHALLGTREGETREVHAPDRDSRPVRVVLIRRRNPG